MKKAIYVFLLYIALIGVRFIHPAPVSAQACGWEGDRYCVYDATDETIQSMDASVRCIENCVENPTPVSGSFTSMNPLQSQQRSGGACLQFDPPAGDVNQMLGRLLTNVDRPETDCARLENEVIVFDDGAFGFRNTQTREFTPFASRTGCLIELVTVASTYEVSLGSVCTDSVTVSFNERLGLVADPWVPQPGGVDPDVIIATPTLPPVGTDPGDDDDDDGDVIGSGEDRLPSALIRCEGENTVETAIGCVDTSISGVVGYLITFSAGIAGGIAFLMLLYGGLQIMISSGDPKRLAAGREQVSAAVAGLLLIIFSVFLLGFVGYNIFGIPGFQLGG